MRRLSILTVLTVLIAVLAVFGIVLHRAVAISDSPWALQFDGVNDYVTFGNTTIVPTGTLTAAPTWQTLANSRLGRSSLLFNGSSQYVTFGAAPELGATNFTIETWFYRTGAGSGTDTSSAGGGGLQGAIPLVTKGRGEGDYSNVDMNYFLGISSAGRIAADFEDMNAVTPNPNNHAIVGTTALANNTWYHAAATFDGATFRLYLNGNLEASAATTATPRWDSIQRAAMGSALNSTGVAAGFFAGRIDEVRIWNVARAQAEIPGSMNSEILTPTTGLIGRWGLNDGAGTVATSLNRLGVTALTLEAWVNRATGGITMTTGTSGFDGGGGRPNGIYPVLTKGMGEGESPANINTNFFLGITVDGFVGADFEDTAGGTNHPAWGTTNVPMGGWHHIAATYTGTCWALYLDGNLQTLNALATACPNATPESTSFQHAGLAAGLSSTGSLGAGRFSGAIDEARIWNYARTQPEITSTMNYGLVTPQAGLIARWGLDEGSGTTINEGAGTSDINGTAVNGPTWIVPGSPTAITLKTFTTLTGVNGLGLDPVWLAAAAIGLMGLIGFAAYQRKRSV